MPSDFHGFAAYAAEHPDSVPIFQAELNLLAGAERSHLALAQWLHSQGRAVHMVTYRDAVGFAQFAKFALPVHAIAPQAGTAGRVLALRRYFREAGTRMAPLVGGYQPALHASLAGIGKFHCLMHDTPVLFEVDAGVSWRHRVSNAVVAWGMKRGGGRMIVTSEFLRRDCQRIFGIDAEIARMGGMVDAGAFRLRPVEGELRLLSVSRIEANKRIDWLLDALAEMELPLSWRLDVVGSGDQLEDVRVRAAELGLGQRVVFHGFVSDEKLARLYGEAHLFVMPAVQGYGIPAIEALQRGIPVLLHRESGVSDVLQGTPWAFVMDGGREALRPALEAAVEAVVRGQHLKAALPELPTEDAWAERVARLCGYL